MTEKMLQNSSSLRLKLYRWVFLGIFVYGGLRAQFLSRFFSSGRRKAFRSWAEDKPESFIESPKRVESSSRPLAWFHTASAGELEILWTVMTAWILQGGDVVVTGFSESAEIPLRRLAKEIGDSHQESRGSLVFVGYSPCEGLWEKALLKFKPSLFVTAKYEAWPELWAALSKQSIPLVMISAKRRSSILLAKYLTRILGYKIPKISFLTVSEEDCSPLQKAFPQSVVRKTGEPRWDRVFGRSKQMSLRAKVLSTSWETQTERPRGILAQVWREDLEIWRELLQELKGSPLWIVPHRVDGPHLEKIIDWLRAEGFSFVQSSTAISDSPTCRLGPSEWVVVDEMGVLAELYRSGDWAYVGGGFGQGVHSTIEPALSGLLVSAGPKKAEKFTEIGELGQQGQLEIVSDRLQLKDWLIKAKSINSETREKFRTLNARHLGATEEILKYLRSVAG